MARLSSASSGTWHSKLPLSGSLIRVSCASLRHQTLTALRAPPSWACRRRFPGITGWIVSAARPRAASAVACRGSATSSITASAPATPPDDHALRICRTAAYERVGPFASSLHEVESHGLDLLCGRDEARQTELPGRLAGHRKREHRVERRPRAADPLRHPLHTARDGHGPDDTSI